MKRNDGIKTVSEIITESFGAYLKNNYKVLVLLFVTLAVTVSLCFVKISTTNTIASFNINDYEVGQIADVTIKAIKTLPADYDNPIPIEKGEKVIRKGFPITEEGYAKLKKMSESPVYIDYRAFANSIIYHILMVVLFFFFFSKIYFKTNMIEFNELVTECVFYMIVFASVIFGSKLTYLSSPFALCAIIPGPLFVFLIAILFGQLNAVFFSIMISLAVLNASSYQLVPFLFVLASSFASSRLVRKIDRRTDMVFVSVLQAVLNAVFIIIFKIIFNGSFANGLGSIVGVILNGFFSGILCLGLLTPLELLLNTASVFRLMDLSDLNNPVMKKMLVTASGTYNHSLMVASLAEAACNEVGANPLLARVGAYYHDIGKMDNPEYFVENQGGGENIHKEINPSLSASVIRTHVKRGIEKAHALRLPKPVIDIISEHHGNQVIAYFYNEALKINPDVSPEDYSYSGNPPSTKESAVVMLADTVEAACRSLDKPSVPRLEKFITTLMTAKIDQKQLEDCNLTFNDITKIHDAFVQILAGYYHSRTKYPDQKDPDGPQAQQNNGENQPRSSEESVKAVEEKESKAEDKKTEDKKVEEKKSEPKKSLKEKAEKIARSSNEKEKKEKN
ncbi:HDIG domain-containing metalloprotein [Treponema sp.]|uniref:HDIG domain-containing metalloprotein n=1 Tax=Treponema sp. TaxID=166 RepID=UPI002A80E624|nr:HDIG domain-containing metalloprotein [Treponema sp.]MCI6442552.1 HDIG domain-containing protein [Spirochaetia bacterium]MDY4133680.1 HDIG domain-containing protein [Treponema sp.]